MKNILTNRTEKETFKNCSISGISLPIYVTANATATAFAGAIIDATKMRLKMTLKGRGNDIASVPNLTLKNLLYLTMVEKPEFDFFAENDITLTLVQGVGIKEKGYILVKFDFGSVINLKGNETLELEYTIDDGFFTAQCDQALSYIQADKIEGIGVEVFTPMFRSEVVNEAQDSQEFQLGDNVIKIVIANYDKSNQLAASQVMTALELDSDKFRRNDTAMELYGKQLDHYPTVAEARSRIQTYIVHDGTELDKCSITLTLNAANVNPSKNYVLWKSYITSASLVQRAGKMQEMHATKDLAKVGLSVRK